MSDVVMQLAEQLANSVFARASCPQGADRIHGLEGDVIPHCGQLFFETPGRAGVQRKDRSFTLVQGQTLHFGTLRNSFFVEPWRKFTNVDDLSLEVTCRGTLRFDLMQSCFGAVPYTLVSKVFAGETMETHRIALPALASYTKNARLFCMFQGISNVSVIQDFAIVTNSPAASTGRVAVLLRTYNRTADIRNLLDRFNADAPRYPDTFDRLFFIILDTSGDIVDQYPLARWPGLELFVFSSVNLGGGGNISHLILTANQAFKKASIAPDEVLVLDDDLHISTESLARHAAFCRHRTSEVAVSLPILLKSEPSVVWEDGGYWGRLGPSNDFEMRRNQPFPTLLRHGWNLHGLDRIDKFGELNHCEYSTFIFFNLPYKTLQKLGYPQAFFLRGDDIEYCLRLQKKGIPLFTNPNLCAWHEPSHSYWNEYMAILHGFIVNVVYGGPYLTPLLDFFDQRAKDHGSVFDAEGLSLYARIAQVFSNPACVVLDIGFEEHYLEARLEFARIDKEFEHISPVIIEQLKAKEEEILNSTGGSVRGDRRGTLIVPFVYMGEHSDKQFKSVLLENIHTGTYRRIDAESDKRRKRMIHEKNRLYAALELMSQRFDEIVDGWRAKIEHSASPEFWERVQARVADQTCVVVGACRQRAEAALRPPEDYNDDAHYYLETPAEADGENGSMISNLPIDFDLQRYLELNTDVRQAGMDPIKHFLLYGRKEGRAWR